MSSYKSDPEREDDSEDNHGSNESGDDGDRKARETAFLCDVMLGSLATYCRMCGYDTADALDRDIEADDRLLGVAKREGRTLLTRDRQLASRAQSSDTGEDGKEESDEHRLEVNGLLLESHDVRDQLCELHAAGYELTVAE